MALVFEEFVFSNILAQKAQILFAGILSAGIAFGHSNTVEDSDGSEKGSPEEYQLEAYYSYPVNDGMTITPLIFTKENSTADKDDTTGIMVKTSFSF